MKLSEAQKDVLDRAANRVRTRIINDGVSENLAWAECNMKAEHKGTLSALYVKGLTLLDDHLTALGITTAKEIWNETARPEDGGEWDTHIAKKIKEKKEREAKQDAERKAWKTEVEKLPVPEGYKLSDYGNLSVEWRAEEFAKMPSIRVEDRNAPYFGLARYEAPEWLIQCNGVGPMDRETVEQFMKALDVAHTVLTTFEDRYVDMEVVSLV